MASRRVALLFGPDGKRFFVALVITLMVAGAIGCDRGQETGEVDALAAQQVTESIDQAHHFTDVSVNSGLQFAHRQPSRELMSIGAGAVVLDFNNDGFHDLYVTNSAGPNALFRNSRDGSFTDIAVVAGVADSDGMANGGCAADYDNDGDTDLYVTNYGPSRLFRNRDDGTFADVTVSAGVRDSTDTFRSTGCAWGDYDNDGFLDLIVVRHLDEWNPDLLKEKDFVWAVGGLVLYRNEGNGVFTDATMVLSDQAVPVNLEGRALGNRWGAGFQPGWVDFDNDGDLDLYVVNDMGADIQPNVLWRNDGLGPDGTWSFVDVSGGSGADVAMWGMGLAVGDYNRDGHLDIFTTNIRDNVLLKNNGDGRTFTDASDDAGVGLGMIGLKLRISWGAVFFDYDNDGYEDLYVVSGYMETDPNPVNPLEQPNLLLRNNGDGTFVDVSSGSGAEDPGVGRGGVYLDFNNDGCLDLFVANFGQPSKLFKGRCDPSNNWLVIEAVGTSSNRDGIGARVTVTAGGTSQIREVAGGSSHMGQNMLEAHFGMREATVADTVSIRWPSGKVQRLTGVNVNQRLIVTEPQSTLGP